MTKTSRSSVIGTRVPPDMKVQFAALAARHELSESGLLAALILEVLKTNDPLTRQSTSPSFASPSTAHGVVEDRITVRLRAGDRKLATVRASVRGMKTCSYLAMLIHNHVRASAVLPPKELEQIKVTCAQLAALGRQLQRFGMPNTLTLPQPPELSELIALTRREVEVARKATAAVVRQNLVSWESNGELRNA